MDHLGKPLSLSQTSFCVTLIGFTPVESEDMEGVLLLASRSTRFDIKREKIVSSASFPIQVIHAIVFTPLGLMQSTAADENVIRSATKLGTCRVYLTAAQGIEPSPGANRLDDFIQRTPMTGSTEVSKKIFEFFREAYDLNRRSTRLAFRDKVCLGAYRILKLLWPVSYLFAALHILNTAAIMTGHWPWHGLFSGQYVISFSSFFGIFFIVHCIFVVVRNWLFGKRIVKKLNFRFALGAVGFGLASAATVYSIVATDQNIPRISFNAILTIGAYWFYMYVRRIRGECTSLSQLQTSMAHPQLRIDMLNTIGGLSIGSSAFPFFPFRSRTLFISYMHSSQWSVETATLAHQWASEHGFEVFLDQSTIPSGALWRPYLLRAISECGIYVAVIDGDTDANEWVLAESTYATLLRKSIGKPRILLVVRNLQSIATNEKNVFRIIYLDIFQLPPAHCYGAAILSVDDDHLTEEKFFKTLEGISPMSLFS